MSTIADLNAALAALETKRRAASDAAAALEASKETAPSDAVDLDHAIATIRALEGEFDALIASMSLTPPAPIAIT